MAKGQQGCVPWRAMVDVFVPMGQLSRSRVQIDKWVQGFPTHPPEGALFRRFFDRNDRSSFSRRYDDAIIGLAGAP